MPSSIFAFEIPIPADLALLEQYLALGWYQLPNPPRLKWSHSRGSPQHPSQQSILPESEAASTLRMLDVALIHELERHLPLPSHFEGKSIEVHVHLAVTFLKVDRRRRYKGSPPLAVWDAAGAVLKVLQVDEGLDLN